MRFTGNDSRKCNDNPLTTEEAWGGQVIEGYLLLPDGEKLLLDLSRNSYGTGWGVFPPLPTGVNNVTLVLPSNLYVPCSSGELIPGKCRCKEEELSWQVPLNFIPLAPGTILPVIDSSTVTPPAAMMTVQPDLTPVSATTVAGSQPKLAGKLVPFDDGYLMLAVIKTDLDNKNTSYSFNRNGQNARLTDATGAEIRIEKVDLAQINGINTNKVFDFNGSDWVLYRTHTRQITGPLMLTFPTLVREDFGFGEEANIKISLGKDIRTGKKISLGNNLDFIPEHPFILKEVSIEAIAANHFVAAFYFEGKRFETITVEQLTPLPFSPKNFSVEPGRRALGTSGVCDNLYFPGCFYNERTMEINPEGLYSLHVNGVSFTVEGPWVLSFNPVGAAK